MDTFKDFAVGTLSAGINSSATSATLTNGHGARFPAIFTATIWNSTDYSSPADAYHAGEAERIRCTRTADALTLVRAQDGTTAVNLNTGGKTYSIVAGLSAKFTEAVDSLTAHGGPATAQYFIFEGDSLTATETVGEAAPDWNTRMMSLSQFSGRGTRLNIAEFGGTISNIAGRYTTYAYPKRPGQDGITKAFYFLWNGSNDAADATVENYSTEFAAWASEWDSICATAKTDGFTVVVFTIIKRPYPSSGAGSGFELVRQLINKHIRHSIDKWDILIDTDQLFPDNTDTVWFAGDFLHMTAFGRQKVADYVNSIFGARGVEPFPPSLNTNGPVIGEGPGEVPSNTLLTTLPRAYDAPQYNAEVTLADASTINWDLDAAPVARLAEVGANKTIAAPTNLRAGVIYTLVVPFNSVGGFTITWDSVFKNTPTLNTSGYRHNITLWYCDGTRMIGLGVHSFDGTPPIDPGEGALIVESFTDVSGAGRLIRGAAPDTLNTPGTLWIAGSGDDWESGGIPAGNPGYATLASPGRSSVYQLLESDFYATTLMRFSDTTGGGVAGIIFRYTDNNNFWGFGINGNGQWEVWKYVSGGYTGVSSGTYTYNDTTGHVLRVEAAGAAILFKLDGTTVHSATSSDHLTATKHGIGNINFGSNRARFFDFEAGT